jgi:hypothetical protein
MLISLLHVVVAVRDGTALCRYGIPRVEYLEVLLRAQQVSCDCTLEYFTYLEVPKMSFGKESTRTNQPIFPPQCFSDKSHSNSKNVKTKTNKMMGQIENGP